MLNVKRVLLVGMCIFSLSAVLSMAACKVNDSPKQNESAETETIVNSSDAEQEEPESIGVVLNPEYNEDAPEHLDFTVMVGEKEINLDSDIQSIEDAGLQGMSTMTEPLLGNCSAILGYVDTDNSDQATKELSVGFYNTSEEEKQPQDCEMFYLSVPTRIEQFVSYDEELDVVETNSVENGITVKNIDPTSTLDDLVSQFGDYYSSYHDEANDTDVYEWNNHDMTEHMQISFKSDSGIEDVTFTKDVVISTAE